MSLRYDSLLTSALTLTTRLRYLLKQEGLFENRETEGLPSVGTSLSAVCFHYWQRFRMGESGYSPLGCPGISVLSDDVWLAVCLCFSL